MLLLIKRKVQKNKENFINY